MIVTTFSPQGYKLYGERFVESYKKHVKYPLTIYVEDDLKIEGVDVRSLYEVPGCTNFIEIVKGIDLNQFKGMKNAYRMNVNKFCRKVFAMTDFGMNVNKNYAFIGADTIFHKDLPETFLDDILEKVYIAYIGRNGFHSETDFIAFNPEFSGHGLFQSLFLRTYTTGAFQEMRHWCDSDVFDHLMKLLSPPANNLNICNDNKHPFVNSIIGEYADHMKGPERKLAGHSFEEDYVNQRRTQVRTV